MIRFHLISLALVSALVLVLAAFPAAGAPGDLLWSFQGIENIVAMTEAPDVDLDGTPEIAVESYYAGASGDHLSLLSGGSSGTAAVLWSIRPAGGASSSGGYGDDCVSLGGDVTADGIDDLLLGTAWGGRSAYAIDSTDGTVVWTFDTYVEQPPVPATSGWVYSVRRAGDLTGDGIEDVILGVGSDNDGAYAVDGVSGALLFRLNAFDAVISSSALGDVNGDMVPDVAFGGGDSEERVLCISGASAGGSSILWFTNVGDGTQHMEPIADLDDDGITDVVVATFGGQVVGLSGASGATLWSHTVGAANPVMRVVPLDDVDGDGLADVAVASWDNATRVVSGGDGTLVWRTPAGGDVWAVDRVDDLTGDGISDVVGGSFDGRVYVYDGVDGSIVWDFLAGDRLFSVRGVSDLSGNGVPDVVAGSQFLDGSGGIVYALEGNDALAAPLPALTHVVVAGGVTLSWPAVTLPPATTFHVYRREVVSGAPAGGVVQREARLALATAPLPQAERLRLAAEWAASESTFERLTDAPLQGAGSALSFTDAGAQAGRRYVYRVGYRTVPGAVELYLGELAVRVGEPRAIGPQIQVLGAAGRPSGFRLTPAANAQPLAVRLYGVDGRLARRLAAAASPATPFDVAWDGRDARGTVLPSGTYLARVEQGGVAASVKFLWLR